MSKRTKIIIGLSGLVVTGFMLTACSFYTRYGRVGSFNGDMYVVPLWVFLPILAFIAAAAIMSSVVLRTASMRNPLIVGGFAAFATGPIAVFAAALWEFPDFGYTAFYIAIVGIAYFTSLAGIIGGNELFNSWQTNWRKRTIVALVAIGLMSLAYIALVVLGVFETPCC